MRYRAMDANRDYSFGLGGLNFLVNSPEAVAQAVLTRLLLWTDEWFLDTSEGTPYFPLVLGKYTDGTRDQAIKSRVLNTAGVVSIDKYNSVVDREKRSFSVAMTITTIYGKATINTVL